MSLQPIPMLSRLGGNCDGENSAFDSPSRREAPPLPFRVSSSLIWRNYRMRSSTPSIFWLMRVIAWTDPASFTPFMIGFSCDLWCSAHPVVSSGHPVPALAGDLADGVYAGALLSWVWGVRKWQGESRDRAKSEDWRGFAVVPWRWIVERTFAWLGRYRRLKSDYERLPETTEAIIHIAMIRLMIRRLVG